MVKVNGSCEMSDERKKLDYEVYPHMVEQLIEKIKEQRERKPEAKERFDKIIARLKKLAKVSHPPKTNAKRAPEMSAILELRWLF